VPAGAVGSVWASGTWSDLAWEANTWANVSAALGNSNPDLNTRISDYLHTFYGLTARKDLTTLAVRYINEECTGEFTARWKQLEDDATA
jgi:hypothetical protein